MRHRFLMFILIALSVWSTATAQEGLNISKLFDGQFRDDKNAVETIITGDPLYEYDLSYYHSLSLSNDSTKVSLLEPLVTKDGATAINKEVSYRGGRLYYAFYTLPPRNGKLGIRVNRYIFYLNQYAVGRNGVILIYMSGGATSEQVKKLIKK